MQAASPLAMSYYSLQLSRPRTEHLLASDFLRVDVGYSSVSGVSAAGAAADDDVGAAASKQLKCDGACQCSYLLQPAFLLCGVLLLSPCILLLAPAPAPAFDNALLLLLLLLGAASRACLP